MQEINIGVPLNHRLFKVFEYASDFDILCKDLRSLNQTLKENAFKEGSKIKTRFMETSRYKNKSDLNSVFQVDGDEIEKFDYFIYLGTIITDNIEK